MYLCRMAAVADLKLLQALVERLAPSRTSMLLKSDRSVCGSGPPIERARTEPARQPVWAASQTPDGACACRVDVHSASASGGLVKGGAKCYLSGMNAAEPIFSLLYLVCQIWRGRPWRLPPKVSPGPP